MVSSGKVKQLLREKGVYLLPNACTLASMFFGFYAIIMSASSQYHDAAIAILIALVLDGLDGRVARLTQTQTDFGGDLDSLSDVISFGVAPSITCYFWQFSDLGKIGLGICFFFVACVALRLARFNNESVEDKHYFKGLPCPAPAALIAAIIWCSDSVWITSFSDWVYVALFILLGLFMVSSLPYYSFKAIGDQGRVPFSALLLVVLLLVLFSLEPAWVTLSFFMVYCFHGVLLSFFQKASSKDHDSDDFTR